jgi:hypothetical protein
MYTRMSAAPFFPQAMDYMFSKGENYIGRPISILASPLGSRYYVN